MNIITRSRKSHQWNEDRFIVGDSYYMVIDGASPLIKNEKMNLTCWMVTYLKKYINRYTGPIKERLEKIAIDAYHDLNIDVKSLAYLPSAGISYLEEDENYYYASILGDCEITFRMNNGSIIRCYTDELTKLDSKAIDELIKIAKEKQIHIIDARPYIQDILIKHRELMNQEGGYNVFTIFPDSKFSAKVFKVKKEDVKEIYIYSDGFSQAFEYLKIYSSHEEMFKNSLDLDEEISKIVKYSFLDPYCDKYPRFKKIDDITVIKIIK